MFFLVFNIKLAFADPIQQETEWFFFGSCYSWVSIEEIYKDAHMYGLKSSNPRAVANSSLAIAWLEATFPELANQAKESGSLLALKARPHVPFDASLALQVFSVLILRSFY